MSQRKIANGNKKDKSKDGKKDKIVMMMKNYKKDRTMMMNHKKEKTMTMNHKKDKMMMKNYVKKKVMNNGKGIIQMMKRIEYKIYKMDKYKIDNMPKKIKARIVLKDTYLKDRDEKKTTKNIKDSTMLDDKKENGKLKAQYEDVLKVFYKLTPELRSQRVTRSVSQVVDHYSKFLILEDYRCMPLLGDEDAVPCWEVHVCKYSIVFVV